MNNEPDDDAEEACEHDWRLVDASFDHEYGCEQVVYDECAKCDQVRPHEHYDCWEGYEN